MENTVLDDLAAAVGYTPARKLAIVYAGRRLCVPRGDRREADEHALSLLIGRPAYRALVREFGGEEIFLPTLAADDRYRRDLAVVLALVDGQRPGQIAERHALSVRRVEQVARELSRRGWLRAVEAVGGSLPPRRGRWRTAAVRLGLEILGTGDDSAEPPGGSGETAAA